MKIYDIDHEIHRCISERRLNQEKDRPATHVRLEKVRALREEIERGAYRINYDMSCRPILFLVQPSLTYAPVNLVVNVVDLHELI
ncbi:MAG: flagellar biosynthesis anti-sigma factor FlgM, partial [Deltaproteobacteria bacterium]|nr:flagellar biosynthesis anti-sigma factor FlgM [Deltaproteobacteria bacterium]